MDLLINLYYSAGVSDLVTAYLQEYRHLLLLVLLVIALLNCFLGYHFRKLWGILAGMAIGAAISAGVCLYIEKTGAILYIAVTLGAFILGLLALLLYRVGLFFICVFLVPFLFTRLFPAARLENLVLWLLLGIIAGTLTLVKEREVISIITSLGGGFGSAKLLMMLQNHQSFMMLLLVGTALSTAGLLLQFQPWRSRSAWNSDEERVRDRHRHKRRMRRIRKKRRHLQKAQQRKNQKTTPRNWGVPKRETTEYTPYTTRPLYQDGDLSHIRRSISRDVSDIYQEQQQDLEEADDALNQLLEQEYQHTTRRLHKR